MIYFVQAQAGDRLIKIGFTDNVRKRVRELRAMNAVELQLLCVIDGALEDEARLHKAHARCWSHGEWFRPNADLLALITHEQETQGLRSEAQPLPGVKPPLMEEAEHLPTSRSHNRLTSSRPPYSLRRKGAGWEVRITLNGKQVSRSIRGTEEDARDYALRVVANDNERKRPKRTSSGRQGRQ